MTAHEACETGVYHLAGGCAVTDADLEADAARFQDGECTGEWKTV
jgi:putative 2-hydroxy-3-oxopropionate reductase